jgi:hypothetical protein
MRDKMAGDTGCGAGVKSVTNAMAIEKTIDVGLANGAKSAVNAYNGIGVRNGAKVAEWPVAAQYRNSKLPLAEIIDAEFNAAQLRELAKWLDVKLKGASKIGFTDQVVTALHERIARMEQSADSLLDGLSSEQIDFVRRLMTARDHTLPLSRTTAFAVWARQFERDGDRKLVEMLDGLRRRALIFPTSPLQYGMRDVYYRWLPLGENVPVFQFKTDPVKVRADWQQHSAAFLDNFDIFLSAVMKSGLQLRAPLPAHEQAARFAWLRDWDYILDDANRVINSRPGWVPDPQTGITIPLLSPFSDEAAARLEDQTGLSRAQCELMFALACAMQLIESPSGKSAKNIVKARANGVEEWLVMTSDEKLRRAWRAYSEEIMLPIEARSASLAARPADAFIVQRAIGARDLTQSMLAAEWCALRRYVTRVLRGLPVNTWVGWDELRDKVFEFLPECMWTIAGRTDWWFAQAGSRARLHAPRRDDWNQTLGRVIERIVRESLLWFGAVDVLLEDDMLAALRVTEVGAWLICTQDCGLPEAISSNTHSVEAISWSKDGATLYAQPAPDRAEFIALARRIAERGDSSFTYVVTPASIEKALAEGISLDEVTRKFKRMGVALPKQVGEQFKLSAKRFGRVRVYQALTVLELSDEMAAKELALNSSLLKRVVYKLSPTAFVLADEDVDALVEEMQAKGYTPRIK